jgi:hypothetical protein
VTRQLLPIALGAALLLGTSAAHADSAATASLNFTVLAGPGFSWVSTASDVSFGESEASAADFAGWIEAAGVFSPNYGAGASNASGTVVGMAVPLSSANASGADTFANGFTFTDGSMRVGALSASAVVPASGNASASAYARSFFTLAPGASVTFSGGLFLSITGNNFAFPANYDTSDLYGYATGLLAVGGATQLAEIGGPSTGAPGSYALNDIQALSLTVLNSGAQVQTYFLESGVYAYSASVVPEPETYALLLGGLAVVGFVARRRSRG